MSDADRQCCPSTKGNLYLHRSELHAQRELDQHDPRAKRESASARAKGRKEGFAASAQKGISFKPLGVLRERDELDDLNKVEVTRVDRDIGKVLESMHSHQESKVKRTLGHTDRGANDGDKDNDGEDLEDKTSRDQAAQKQKRQVHSLDLRPGRRGLVDGFDLLRQGVHESEVRLAASKTDGQNTELLDGASELERLMPPRYMYPSALTDKRRANAEDALKSSRLQSKRGAGSERSSYSARGTLQVVAPAGPSGSRSARGPPPVAPPALPSVNAYAGGAGRAEARRSPRMAQLQLQLPSLAEFIVASGPAMGDRGGPARGDRTHVQQAVNELLGVQPSQYATLKLTQEDIASGKRRNNFTKRLDKNLENAWQDKDAWKRMYLASHGERVGVGDDPKVIAGTVAKESETSHPAGAGGGEEGGAAVASGSRRKRDAVEATQAEAEQHKQEPDATTSRPWWLTQRREVDRLRATLVIYQETRVRYRAVLESTLASLETNRTESVKRRACQPDDDAGDANDRMKQQHQWYRSLWSHVQNDKRELKENNVAHFIFDFVKSVLEHGKVFSSDMYFAMLGEIENGEFSFVISSLVVNMIFDMDNVETDDILDWFQENRAAVPRHIEEVINQRKRSGDEAPPAASSEQALGDGRAVTFVTEAV